MDRLIWTAWRAFWVGLGASAVLIAQSLMSVPSTPAATGPAAQPEEIVAPIARESVRLPTPQAVRSRVPNSS